MCKSCYSKVRHQERYERSGWARLSNLGPFLNDSTNWIHGAKLILHATLSFWQWQPKRGWVAAEGYVPSSQVARVKALLRREQIGPRRSLRALNAVLRGNASTAFVSGSIRAAAMRSLQRHFDERDGPRVEGDGRCCTWCGQRIGEEAGRAHWCSDPCLNHLVHLYREDHRWLRDARRLLREVNATTSGKGNPLTAQTVVSRLSRRRPTSLVSSRS